MSYIALPDTWFDAGTVAELIDDYRGDGFDFGLFRGIRDGQLDEEVCLFSEFGESEVSE